MYAYTGCFAVGAVYCGAHGGYEAVEMRDVRRIGRGGAGCVGYQEK